MRYGKVGFDLFMRPLELVKVQQKTLSQMTSLWTSAFLPSETTPSDKRFKDDAWNCEAFNRALRDVHLAIEEATDTLLENLPKGGRERLRVEFYTRQIVSALSPSNYFVLNPKARQKFLETQGKSLLDGFENFLDDLEAGDGRLEIATNDPDAFVVGQDLATAPGKVVFQNDLMQLIQYAPTTETQRARPILLVPAWINKFYILDLRERNSLVRHLIDRGHTVFLISWVNPTEAHADKSFEDYMNDGPLAALDAIQTQTDATKINILGFCIGGILVTATLAYLTAKGDDRIGSATTLATMVDFTEVGDIGVFIDNDRLEALRHHVSKTGYLENHHLQDMFSMLRENDMIWSYHVMRYLLGEQPPAFDLLFWNSDSTRLPAAMLLWYLEHVYLRNSLRAAGEIELNGMPINIGDITTPCYVLATKEDHIAPWRSVYPTTRLFAGDVQFVLGGSGHIAGVINPPGVKDRYGYWIGENYPESPDSWLDAATHQNGSWWPHWTDWLEKKDRAKHVPARDPSKGSLGVIEDAPGSYVQAE